jgi:large subunit ribosomal protein L3
MAHRPRKRAINQNARVYWQEASDKRVLGFAGYKVGMTHVAYVDNSESPTKGQEVVSAATVLEVPPITIYGLRCYSNGSSIGDVLSTDEKILKLAGFMKKHEQSKFDDSKTDDVRLLVFACPDKTSGMSKKHIERMELGCGGKDAKEKLEFCRSMLGKDLRISDVFKNGEFIDVVSISKGKGWQGAVKRFGVAIQRRKATGKRRHVGTLGQWHPAYVLYTVPMAGQTGYHKRTEMNKMILKIGNKPEEVNPTSGFPTYGFVKGDFVVVKGSVAGPVRRLVKLRLAVRAPGGAVKEPQASYISLSPR